MDSITLFIIITLPWVFLLIFWEAYQEGRKVRRQIQEDERDRRMGLLTMAERHTRQGLAEFYRQGQLDAGGAPNRVETQENPNRREPSPEPKPLPTPSPSPNPEPKPPTRDLIDY